MRASLVSPRLLAPLATIVICVVCSLAKDDGALREDIKKYDTCVQRSVFSFKLPESSPPKTQDELKTRCQTQSEGFKCLREQTKGSEALIRRGLLTLASTRQRQHKRLCSNTGSDFSKKFVAYSKCILDNKSNEMVANEDTLLLSMGEILRRNYNDSAAELKQICCALHNYKQKYYELAGEACPKHKAMFAELMGAIVTDDMTIICEDDEKLAKVCAAMGKLTIDPSVALERIGANEALYLIATLGEPEKGKPVLN